MDGRHRLPDDLLYDTTHYPDQWPEVLVWVAAILALAILYRLIDGDD